MYFLCHGIETIESRSLTWGTSPYKWRKINGRIHLEEYKVYILQNLKRKKNKALCYSESLKFRLRHNHPFTLNCIYRGNTFKPHDINKETKKLGVSACITTRVSYNIVFYQRKASRWFFIWFMELRIEPASGLDQRGWPIQKFHPNINLKISDNVLIIK